MVHIFEDNNTQRKSGFKIEGQKCLRNDVLSLSAEIRIDKEERDK